MPHAVRDEALAKSGRASDVFFYSTTGPVRHSRLGEQMSPKDRILSFIMSNMSVLENKGCLWWKVTHGQQLPIGIAVIGVGIQHRGWAKKGIDWKI